MSPVLVQYHSHEVSGREDVDVSVFFPERIER